MATSFSDLKKRRNENKNNLKQQIAKTNKRGGSFEKDPRYWDLTVDPKTGSGSATIRFLDAPKGEDQQYVLLYNHGFQGPGGAYYIENCRSTLNNSPDPAHEFANRLYKSEDPVEKKFYDEVKRRKNFHSNILVVKDPGNPENEGKVFLFRYGSKILDKINLALNPEFEDQEEINAFDMFEGGANFKLRARRVDKQRNYDSSEFDSPAPISDDDEEIEKIWEQCHSLKDLIDPKNFKSYADLKKHLNFVMSGEAAEGEGDSEKPAKEEDTPSPSRPRSRPMVDTSDDEPAPQERKRTRPAVKVQDDDDEALEAYKNLMAD